ncbi:MAG TPA: AAA family ATPase [Candidatus Polarisedimenticolaceae bacterium]
MPGVDPAGGLGVTNTMPRKSDPVVAPSHRPWIVLLNGASCSGKSALARELVERSPAPVIHLSLDHHHDGLAGRYATDRWPLYRELCAGLARSAEAWWRQGFHVVVDTLLESPRAMRETLALLPRARTVLVGLHAPLEVLLERAGARPAEARRRIRRQFPLVRTLAAYDLELATDRESPRALAERILAHLGTAPRSQPAHEALDGLRPIEVGDRETFTRAAQAGGCRTWLHYFPFLHALARTVRRELRWEEVDGSVLVYHVIDVERGPRLSLYVPPFPFTAAALAHARRRCRRFDAAAPTRILWVEEASLPALAGVLASKRAADSEYVYDGARVSALVGERFAALRGRLDRIERVPGLAVRSYAEGDRAACEDLIEAWRGRPRNQRANSAAYRLALLCLAHHADFGPEWLRGEVLTQDGRVRAVTFGGPICEGWGSLFVVLADPRMPGLGDLQRYRFIRNNPDLRLWKELGDVDGPQLAAIKGAFDPVARNPLWRVALRDGNE